VFLAVAMAALLLVFGNTDSIVSLSNVVAIAAMLIVDGAAFRLALQHWPGKGMRLAGGVTIPTIAALTAAVQLPSLGWRNVGVGFGLIFAGLFVFALRHRPELAEDTAPVLRAIEFLETPLARALRRREHVPEAGAARAA
jgi:hypothetical protein